MLILVIDYNTQGNFGAAPVFPILRTCEVFPGNSFPEVFYDIKIIEDLLL